MLVEVSKVLMLLIRSEDQGHRNQRRPEASNSWLQSHTRCREGISIGFSTPDANLAEKVLGSAECWLGWSAGSTESDSLPVVVVARDVTSLGTDKIVSRLSISWLIRLPALRLISRVAWLITQSMLIKIKSCSAARWLSHVGSRGWLRGWAASAQPTGSSTVATGEGKVATGQVGRLAHKRALGISLVL
jgi:hypothetical protein